LLLLASLGLYSMDIIDSADVMYENKVCSGIDLEVEGVFFDSILSFTHIWIISFNKLSHDVVLVTLLMSLPIINDLFITYCIGTTV